MFEFDIASGAVIIKQCGTKGIEAGKRGNFDNTCNYKTIIMTSVMYFFLEARRKFLFLTLCCPLFCYSVKHKELMPELLTANYPATVYPLPGSRQADVELMQSPVSFDSTPQLRRFKQPPFQPKYFTILTPRQPAV